MLEQKLSATTKSLEETLNHAKVLAKSLTESKEKHNQKSRDLKEVVNERDSLQKRLSEVKAELQRSNSQRLDLQKKNETLTQALTDAAENMAELEREVQAKQDIIDSLDTEIEGFRQAAAQWQREKEATVLQEKQRQSTLNSFLADQQVLIAEVNANEHAIQNLSTLLHTVSAEKHSLMQELQKCKEQLKTTKDTIATKEVEDEVMLDEFRKNVEVSEAKRFEEVGQLLEELDRERKDRIKAENYLSKLREVVDSLESSLGIFKAKNSVLENQLIDKTEKEALLKSALTEIESLQGSIGVEIA